MEYIYEIWNKSKQRINEPAGKITGNEKTQQINSFFDEVCQIRLEDKKGDYSKMINRNTRKNEQEYTGERKEALKIFRKKKVLFKSKLEQMEIAYTDNETEILSRSK